METNLLKSALELKAHGYSIIAVDDHKRSIGEWRQFTTEIATKSVLESLFNNPRVNGIAVICGAVSGNLEVIDVDVKNDTTGRLFQDFVAAIQKRDPKLSDNFVIAQTRSGGFHLLYRCASIGRNEILARRPTTDAERVVNPKEKAKVLVETRGNGGYAVIAPTQGYWFLQKDLLTIPTITTSQRSIILDTARAFNQYQPVILTPGSQPRPRPPGLSPLDDYNQRGDIIGLLVKHGWSVVDHKNNRTLLKRPGETDKYRSGDYNHELGLFSVFTTSTEFEPGRGYRPYAVYAMLECGGDFKEAVRQLARQGFGQPQPIKQSHQPRRLPGH
ncbi:bifunctional DNA primase/polymerase [Chitinophaga defluvii]|uniref:Bifunctional DNA primase/polymerase n=1 Tax=Chitinophaga defluvii TaxID=3163343 RepID=A0ABV2T8Q5_9BACT